MSPVPRGQQGSWGHGTALCASFGCEHCVCKHARSQHLACTPFIHQTRPCTHAERHAGECTVLQRALLAHRYGLHSCAPANTCTHTHTGCMQLCA